MKLPKPNLSHFFAILITLSCLSFTGMVYAESDAPKDSFSLKSEKDSKYETEPAHPVMVEIKNLLDAQKIKLTELKTLLTETDDHHEIIRIHREIEEVKVSTEIKMFQCQIRHAVETGNTEIAEFLQETVDAIEARLEADKERRAEHERTRR